MRTEEREVYRTVQRSVLLVLVVLITICTFCALINNATILKNDKFNNSFEFSDENLQVFGQNSAIEKTSDSDAVYVYISGKPIGISINTEGLIVVDKSIVKTEKGEISPTKNADIQKGDVLLGINSTKVSSIYQLKKLLSSCNKSGITAEILRNGKTHYTYFEAVKDKADGQYKLGLLLKEDVGGVGTLTFVTENGKFAGLGHRISDGESGVSEALTMGNIYNATVTDVIKGEKGKAGGLVADVNKFSKSIGEICANTNIGLYGDYLEEIKGETYRIALKGEAKIGKAQVLTTINGDKPKFYDIEIVKVISQNEAGEKGMVISVCDKELLEKTGGIVQGMSGSPIVQNGILIGAVTHVFVQDPTRGYAVHSRFMYEYAKGLEDSSDLTTLVA